MKLSRKILKGLKKEGVQTLYLFGSRAQGVARPKSDYDFGVLLSNPSIIKSGGQELYQKIYDLLQDAVLERVNMDIVFLDQAPLQLCYHVIRHGQLLADENPSRRGRFEEDILEKHADFEPYRRLFEEATISRIP